MGDATGASAASAAPGTAAPAAASGRLTIRVLANDAKLLSLFTLMNQSTFVVENWEARTCNTAKVGAVWAVKAVRELLEIDARTPESPWARKLPTEAVRLSPLTYAVRASTPACICVQTIKDWVRDELKRLVDKKLTPAPTGAGDEESTEEQRLLDEAVDNFQEALDIERAKRQSLSKQSEREAVTAAGLISEDEAISNMAQRGKPARGPSTPSETARAKQRRRLSGSPEDFASQLGSVPSSPDLDRNPDAGLMSVLDKAVGEQAEGRRDSRDQMLLLMQQQAQQMQAHQQQAQQAQAQQAQQNQQMMMMMMMMMQGRNAAPMQHVDPTQQMQPMLDPQQQMMHQMMMMFNQPAMPQQRMYPPQPACSGFTPPAPLQTCVYGLDECILTNQRCLSPNCQHFVCTWCATRICGTDMARGYWYRVHAQSRE